MKIWAGLSLSIVLFPSIIYADQIPAAAKLAIINNFDTGLVTNLSSNKQIDTSSTKTRNFYIDKKIGCLVKGNGTAIMGSTASLADIRQGITFYHSDGSKEYLVSDGSQVVTTKDFQSYTLVVGGFNKSFNIRMKQIESNIWITNGNDTVAVYTSTGGLFRLTFVPKGKDIEYNPDGRVWMYNTPDDNSALYWSATRSTDGFLVAPTDVRAWPANYLVYVNRGDGDQGTFVRNLNGILLCGKENSIWRINGTEPSSYLPVLVSRQGGIVSPDSVVEISGYLYGQGRDAFYEINAGGMRRITDQVAPDIANVRSDTSKSVSYIWNKLADWNRGNFTASSATILNPNLLSKSTYTQPGNDTDLNNVPALSSVLLTSYTVSGSTSTGWLNLVTTNTIEASYVGSLQLVQIWVRAKNSAGNSDSKGFRISVRNNRTGSACQETGGFTSPVYNGGIWQVATEQYDSATPVQNTIDISGCDFTAADIQNSSFSIKIDYRGLDDSTNQNYDLIIPTNTGGAKIQFKPSVNSQFVSDIATISTNISAWNTFTSNNNANGGTINYFYRTSTSSVNISTYPWISIAAGAVINSSISNNYFQWATTMTVSNDGNSYYFNPNISNVTVNDVEGNGANTRSFSTKWDNRWWIGVSTESTGNYPLVYVKCKNVPTVSQFSGTGVSFIKDAFTQFDGIPVRCFWKDKEDTLYGGGSTWPVVMRLDYGSDYNGLPIDAYWDTPDMPLEKNFFEKEFNRWLIDVDQTPGGIIKLGTSVNQGDFVFSTYTITGSGRLLYPIYANSNNILTRYGKTIKFRIENNDLDKPFTFNAIGLLYLDTEREQ